MGKDKVILSGCLANFMCLFLVPPIFIYFAWRYGTLFVAPSELLFFVPVGLLVLLYAFHTIPVLKYVFAVFSWISPICVVLAWVLYFIQSPLLMPPKGAMTVTDFRYHYVAIYEYEQVIFSNPIQGHVQKLCAGTNGTCDQGVGDDVPDALIAPGLLIRPGQTIAVTFPNSGAFSITSTTTPYMNMTLHIFDPND